MTQLFGRGLFIKYYKKDDVRQKPKEGQSAMNMPLGSQDEPIDHGDEPPSPGFGDDSGVGFAPAEDHGDYFNDLPQIREEHGLEGMLIQRRAAPSANRMEIDPFKI